MKHNPRTCNAFHSACENVRDVADEARATLLRRPMVDPIVGERANELVVWAESRTLSDLDSIADGYVLDGLSVCTC